MVRSGASSETMMPVMIDVIDERISDIDNFWIGLNHVIQQRSSVMMAVRICSCSIVISLKL